MSQITQDAAACIEAAIRAVDPRERVASLISDLSDSFEGGCHVVAVGKAARRMASGAVEVLGERIRGGVVISTEAGDVSGNLQCFVGRHPIPNEDGVTGAHAVESLARDLGPEDHLLVLLSGGGSALLTLPSAGVSLEDLNLTTAFLMRSGAAIEELNTVRKNLEGLKGGRLAQIAAPARITALVLSDVVGDALDVIASGPVIADTTTSQDALGVIDRFHLQEVVPTSVLEHLNASKLPAPVAGDACFDRVDVHVVANNATAVEGAAAEARRLGYNVHVLRDPLVGDAADAGRVLAALARSLRSAGDPVPAPACVVGGGETVVKVEGDGLGGRNQELAVSAALFMDGVEDACVASAGTDGIDGPTEAAGGFVTGETVRRALERGLDPRAALLENDSHTFLRAMDQLIVTGATGTNVADIQLVLVR